MKMVIVDNKCRDLCIQISRHRCHKVGCTMDIIFQLSLGYETRRLKLDQDCQGASGHQRRWLGRCLELVN